MGRLRAMGSSTGFDSLVQAACGIATRCGSGDAPGALPVQALDHATGYLAAAAALRLLTHRESHGRAAHARLALVHTANLLLRDTVTESGGADLPDPSPFRRQVTTPEGALGCLAPVGSVDGTPLEWPRGVQHPIATTEI
ncbi:MAG: CoA transferase [Thermoleophilia bacterium]